MDRVVVRHAEGTDDTQRVLYWECGTRVYYAGEIGTSARFPTRPPRNQQPLL
jgi:hypothetical protein